jgi:hypothetical protein
LKLNPKFDNIRRQTGAMEIDLPTISSMRGSGEEIEDKDMKDEMEIVR